MDTGCPLTASGSEIARQGGEVAKADRALSDEVLAAARKTIAAAST